MRAILASSIFLLVIYSCFSHGQAIPVSIAQTESGYQLLRGGEPYTIRGVGTNSTDLDNIARHGGNSIRTWSVDRHIEPAQQLLDRAHAMGMTVSLCLEFAKERYGFDFNDETAVNALLEQTREKVMRFKDHPALLVWIIGNEVNLNYTNPKVFDAINRAAAMIKEIDPNHPTTTALAGFDHKAIKDIEARAPELDFISFQAYASLNQFPEFLADAGYRKPFFVTEWGAIGHWEGASTEWGAYIESTSTEKAEHYGQSYNKVIAALPNLIIGNYVFLWGQKQEKTPTWYGMELVTGEETQAMDMMYYLWRGEWPDNQAPHISPITLDKKRVDDNVRLNAGKTYKANVNVKDPDGDPITYVWEIRHESTATQIGGDKEALPEALQGLVTGTGHSVSMKAPAINGAYRLFVYAYDNHNNAAHANFPFYVD